MSTQEFNFEINIPFTETSQFNTLVTPFESGKEQRRRKWSQQKRMFEVALNAKDKTVEDRIWSFYQAREGAYDTFYFENSNESPTSKVASTTAATGSNAAFSFPNYPFTSGDVTIYKNAVASGDEGVDYSVNRSTGVVTFGAGKLPQAGAAISADYHFAYTVRFQEDKMTRELFSYRLWNTGVKLIQVF